MQAESGPGAEGPTRGARLLDGQLQPLHEPGQPSRAGGVAASQVGELVGQDRA